MKKIYLVMLVFTMVVHNNWAQCISANGGTIHTPSTIYCGTPVTLTILNPQLRDNTQWVWYSGTCGGTQVGTGLSINVSPTSETTYFVRGEGGCATSACRPSITITAPTLGSITSVSSGVERCGLGTVTLTAQADQGTINWFRTPTEVVVRGTGTSFTAGAQNFGTNTYYAEVSNGGCVTSPRTAVTFNVKDMPGFSSSGSSAACPGQTATITAIPNSNSTFSGWYDAPTGGNLVSASGVFTTPPLTTPVTYYGVVTHTNGCTDNATWTPNIKSQPVLSSTTSGERCGQGSVDLSAIYTVSGTTISQYEWYSSPTGGFPISTLQNFSTPSISSTTTYYVSAISMQGCYSATRVPVVATIKTVPTITSTVPASRCGDGDLTLSATGSAGTLEWYNAETGGTQVGTGTSYTTPSLIQTTPYFVQATFNGCTSGRTSVPATINPIPTLNGFSNAECGSGPVALGATSDGTISWYAASIGGTSIATGSTFVTPAITSTTTYYIESTLNGCTLDTRQPVTAIIKPMPIVESTTGAEQCGDGTLNLMATSSTGSSLEWFDTEIGGTQLGTGQTFITPYLSQSTPYFVQAALNGCFSARTQVLGSIKPIPTLNTFSNQVCDIGPVTIGATSDGVVSWFAEEFGGSPLATGNSFTTPAITSTTTYYLEASLNGCTTPTRSTAVAEVRKTPVISSVSSDERCGPGTISVSASASAGATLWYDAQSGGNQIGTSISYTTDITETSTFYASAYNQGCESSRSSVMATIKPFPTLSSSGDVSNCGSGTIQLQATSNGNISWFTQPTGGSIAATGTTLSNTFSTTTNFYVDSELNGCFMPNRLLVKAIVIPIPAQPTITQNNSNIEAPILSSSSPAGNQWFKNDVAISGATNSTYIIVDDGIYKVQVTSNGCVGPISSGVSYVITGFEVPNENLLSLFPNPSSEELTISLDGFDINRLVNVSLVDLNGRPMTTTSGFGGEKLRFNVSALNSGSYAVIAKQGTRRAIRRFIKSL